MTSERATAVDPYKGGATVPLTQRLADPVEESTLHMVNADPEADADVHALR